MPGPDFAAIIAVGPAEGELERVADTCDSLWCHEPACRQVVLIDDSGRGCSAYDLLSPPASCRVDVIPNPRKGRGIGWSGGLCTAIRTGLASIDPAVPLEFVLKLDTDALVIAPFSARIAGSFREAPHAGMVGAFRSTPNGEPRDFAPWRPLMMDLSRRWVPRSRRARTGRKRGLAFWGAPATIRRHVLAAMAQSYEPGENCQGGAYAVRMDAVVRMKQAGYLADPLLWLNTACGEDVMFSMYVRAVGYELHGFAGAGDVFGIRYKGLPDTPDHLLARGYAIIHSVKTEQPLGEHRVRALFQRHRSAVRAATVDPLATAELTI